MASTRPLLEVRDISLQYGPVKALEHLTLELYQGETVALLGANGAGKTSLLGGILGLWPLRAGTILYRGARIDGRPVDKTVRAGLCLVPEGSGVFTSMSVLDNLLLGSYKDRLSGAQQQRRLARVFSWFPLLKARTSQLAATLSGGERQMLAFGRVLMAEPTVIMVDEPSMGLAPLLVKEIFSILKNLNNEGYTILVADQHARNALQIAHRGYVLETGSLVCAGTARELLNDARVQAAYLGGA